MFLITFSSYFHLPFPSPKLKRVSKTDKMGPLQRFECWGDDPLDMDPETHFIGPLAACPISRTSRDIASLNHLRTWINDPVLETAGRRRRKEMAHHFVQVANELNQAAVARWQEAIRVKAVSDSKTAAT